MSREKRNAPRYRLPFEQSQVTPAAIESDGARFTGHLLDISRSGMSVRVAHEIIGANPPAVGHAAIGEFWGSRRLLKVAGTIARFVGDNVVALRFAHSVEQIVLDEMIARTGGEAYWGPTLRIVGVLDATLRKDISAAVFFNKPLDLSGVTGISSAGAGLVAVAIDKKACLQDCSPEAKRFLMASGLCERCGKCNYAPLVNAQSKEITKYYSLTSI